MVLSYWSVQSLWDQSRLIILSCFAFRNQFLTLRSEVEIDWFCTGLVLIVIWILRFSHLGTNVILLDELTCINHNGDHFAFCFTLIFNLSSQWSIHSTFFFARLALNIFKWWFRDQLMQYRRIYLIAENVSFITNKWLISSVDYNTVGHLPWFRYLKDIFRFHQIYFGLISL